MPFWGELKRRNVYKVGVAYAIVAWLLIQGASIIFPHLNLPSWVTTFVIVILIIGFPIALLLAWAYEVTPEGIKQTKEVPLAESITHLTGKKLNYIVIGLLVLAVAYIVFDKVYIDQRAYEPKVVSTETEQAPAVSEVEEAPKTIAVLPFTDLSPEKDQEYFVDGLSEEIINSLTQIPNLGVTGRTSSFTFKGSNKKTQEIANELGVDHILEGSVRKAGNELRVTAQLIQAADDLHLWSKTYDSELKDVADIFSIQEDIATAVGNELKLTLGIDNSIKVLGGTENKEAYELYLVALGQHYRDENSLALESIDTALDLDPGFALAWNLKSRLYIISSFLAQTKDVSFKLFDAALTAANKTIEIEPNLGSGYIKLGNVKTLSGDFVEAELYFRKAIELLKESLSGDDDFIIAHYLWVGKFNRASELIEHIRRYDPLHTGYPGYYMFNMGYIGDTQQAEDEYERCKAMFGDNYWFKLCITAVRIGSGDAVSRDKVVYSDPIHDVAKGYLNSPEKGLVELRRLYANNNIRPQDLDNISLWAAYFGDPNFAMDALEKKISNNISGDNRFLWLPVFREVRQLPRFKEYIREIGLVDYWNEFGWPEICHKLDNGDFECD